MITKIIKKRRKIATASSIPTGAPWIHFCRPLCFCLIYLLLAAESPRDRYSRVADSLEESSSGGSSGKEGKKVNTVAKLSHTCRLTFHAFVLSFMEAAFPSIWVLTL